MVPDGCGNRMKAVNLNGTADVELPRKLQSKTIIDRIVSFVREIVRSM